LNSFFRNFRFWLPVFLWLVVIAIESMFLSSGVTSGWLWRAFRFLHIPIYIDVFDRIHHFLRKAGHVTGYGILCVLAFRACYRTLLDAKTGNYPFSAKYRRRAALLALGLTLLVAILDEWHQSFDPSRTSSVRDVGLDLLGGVIFLSVALFILKRWRENSARELEPVSA
jgi:VanZ family protein